MRLEVDTGGYTSACGQFYDANHGVVDAVVKLSSTLGDSGAMAGSDTGGQTWAGQYDAAAGPLLQAGSQMGQAMAQMANLLNASLRNHDGADFGSRVYGPPVGSADDGDPHPGHWSESVSAPDPPSAYGGTGDQPGWWHWIAGHVGGLLWPDADTGQLRAAGDAWRTAGQALAVHTSSVSAASAEISTQRSPEVHDAVATCDSLRGHLDELASSYTAIGQACSDYADQVDEHHREIEHELASFIEWTIGIEVGGAIVGAFTLGLGEGAAQAVEAAKVAEAAAKVVAILQRLIEVARLAALRIGELVAKVARVGEGLRGLLGARTVKALEETGELAADDAKFFESIPKWADGGEIPMSGPGADLYAGGVERYGGLTREQFMKKYWDAEKGTWRWPPDEGFAGEALPNSMRPGDVIDRLGNNEGYYASPQGTAFGDRAIPPSNIAREYHRFEVLKPLPESGAEAVTEGRVAPWFEQAGGGVQYKFTRTIDWYIENGYLREIP